MSRAREPDVAGTAGGVLVAGQEGAEMRAPESSVVALFGVLGAAHQRIRGANGIGREPLTTARRALVTREALTLYLASLATGAPALW
jgi:hypothetical protein